MDNSIYQAFVNFDRRKPSSTPSLFNFLITKFWRANKAHLNLYIFCAYLCLFRIKLLAFIRPTIIYHLRGGGGVGLCHNKIYLIPPLPQRLCRVLMNPPHWQAIVYSPLFIVFEERLILLRSLWKLCVRLKSSIV